MRTLERTTCEDSGFAAVLDNSDVGAMAFNVKFFIQKLLDNGDYDRASTCLESAKDALGPDLYADLLPRLSGYCLDKAHVFLKDDDFAAFEEILSFVRVKSPDLHPANYGWEWKFFTRYFGGPLQAMEYERAFAFLDVIQPHLDADGWSRIARSVVNQALFLHKNQCAEHLKDLNELINDRPIPATVQAIVSITVKSCDHPTTSVDNLLKKACHHLQHGLENVVGLRSLFNAAIGSNDLLSAQTAHELLSERDLDTFVTHRRQRLLDELEGLLSGDPIPQQRGRMHRPDGNAVVVKRRRRKPVNN